jgi:hypothetical protein
VPLPAAFWNALLLLVPRFLAAPAAVVAPWLLAPAAVAEPLHLFPVATAAAAAKALPASPFLHLPSVVDRGLLCSEL